jgi:hypothetical protein
VLIFAIFPVYRYVPERNDGVFGGTEGRRGSPQITGFRGCPANRKDNGTGIGIGFGRGHQDQATAKDTSAVWPGDVFGTYELAGNWPEAQEMAKQRLWKKRKNNNNAWL